LPFQYASSEGNYLQKQETEKQGTGIREQGSERRRGWVRACRMDCGGRGILSAITVHAIALGKSAGRAESPVAKTSAAAMRASRSGVAHRVGDGLPVTQPELDFRLDSFWMADDSPLWAMSPKAMGSFLLLSVCRTERTRSHLHEKNATTPPMESCSPCASIPRRRLLRQ